MILRLFFALLALVSTLCAAYPHTEQQRLALEQIFERLAPAQSRSFGGGLAELPMQSGAAERPPLGEEESPPSQGGVLQTFGLSNPSKECPLFWVQQGKERWDFDQRYEERSEELYPLFRQAGLVDEVLPSKKTYDVILVHGSTFASLQQRLLFAYDLLEQGVKCHTLVFLGGYRVLRDKERSMLGNDPNFRTEMDMTRWLYLEEPLLEKEGILPRPRAGALRRPIA